MQKGFAYIDGEFVPMNEAKISVMDLTIQRGYGITEVFRTYSGKPFLMDEHMHRLRNSIRLMGMKNTAKEKDIRGVITKGLRKMYGEALIKILITGGPSSHITPLGRSGLIVFFLPFHAHPARDYERGFRMMTMKAKRVLPAAKSTDYFAAILGQMEAEEKGFDEAIYTDGKKLYEGTTFTIGVIQGNRLIVPKKDVLDGITMLATLRVARRAGLRVVRRSITFADIKKADEMISTSTIREIMSVVQVDQIKIGSGRPGKYAKILLDEFRQYARNKSSQISKRVSLGRGHFSVSGGRRDRE